MKNFLPDQEDALHVYHITHEDWKEPIVLEYETYAGNEGDALMTSYVLMSLKLSHAGFTPPWMTQN